MSHGRFKNTWGTQMAVSYGWNGGPYGLGAAYGFNCCYTGSWPKTHGMIKMNEVAHPAGTVMAGDYAVGNGRYEYYYGNNYSPFGRKVTNFSNYHNGGANMIWADGHASGHKLHEMAAEDFDRRYTR